MSNEAEHIDRVDLVNDSRRNQRLRNGVKMIVLKELETKVAQINDWSSTTSKDVKANVRTLTDQS